MYVGFPSKISNYSFTRMAPTTDLGHFRPSTRTYTFWEVVKTPEIYKRVKEAPGTALSWLRLLFLNEN
jgi:hypothetical protein